jgi:hypothetical protein
MVYEAILREMILSSHSILVAFIIQAGDINLTYFCTGLGEPPPASLPIPELSAAEERSEARSWRSIVVAGLERRIDMKVIEPYKRVCFTIVLNLLVPNSIIFFCFCTVERS